MVELSGPNQNTWSRIKKLAAAWNKLRDQIDQQQIEGSAPKIQCEIEAKRRSRTPLKPSEIDSIRTLRAAGVSVNQLAKQFGVHRATIWKHSQS